ncbi:MAG: GNAT family N-acetyltransferase [Thiohalomonadales bacterium]
MNSIQILPADWKTQHTILSEIRRTVFIEEQQVPEELEWDELDPSCLHVLALDSHSDIPVGTGRLSTDGKIGRMAVIKQYRRRGIGCEILKKLIELAIANGSQQVYLHAQLQALPFYQTFEFVIEGKTFMEAGISHVKLVKRCAI